MKRLPPILSDCILKLAVFVFLCTAAGRLNAQESETTSTEDQHKSKHSPDSALVMYFSPDVRGIYQMKYFSKPLTNFQEFDASKQQGNFYVLLGNAGSASYPLVYNARRNADFSMRNDYHSLYKLHDDSIRIYQSKTPFSHLNYMMGGAKEQKLNFELSQRLGDGIYAGIHARFANAPGIYLRQRNYYAGATFFATFMLPAKRYGAIITLKTDKATLYENGGLAQPELFTQNTESNRKAYLVKLSKAMNRDKESGVVFQHYFSLQKPSSSPDSLTANDGRSRKFDAGRLAHTFKYSRSAFAYEDLSPEVAYYPVFYNDSTLVYDSTRNDHLENIFVYSNEEPDTSGRAFPLQYSFGIKQQTDRLWKNETTYTNRQLVPFGSLKGIIRGKTFFKASGQLALGGYNSGDYLLEGSFYQFFGKQRNKLFLNVSKGFLHPSYFFNHYTSDNFRWDNSYGQQNVLSGEAGVAINGLVMQAAYSRITGYTFFDLELKPRQSEEALSVINFRLNKTFSFGHWLSDVSALVQQCSPDTLLQLPQAAGRASICYDRMLFKSALHAQIGLSGTYHSKWKQDAYSPALAAFYKQDSFTAGNYPYVDVFVNINVKRARFFVKYEHVNAKFTGFNYMIVPGYPQADALFKFGVSWVFFD